METLRSALVDLLAADLAEIDAAISLVTGGVALRVKLVGLPEALGIAGTGLAHAQAAGVGFRVLRDVPQGLTIEIGPRIDEPVAG